MAVPDARQYRQHVGFAWHPDYRAFAIANPGKLYIHGDEPDQAPSCITPSAYATMYHDFVDSLHAADPTAKVSPAGFAEPNPDCNGGLHSTDYASAFVQAYTQQYGFAPPVDEWRFHDFGLNLWADTTAWKARVAAAAQWSVDHGAPMVLGSWGFINENWDSTKISIPTFQYYMRQMMLFLQRDVRINQAVWWSYDVDPWYSHRLTTPTGAQSPEGYTYQWYPPAEIPTGVSAAGASGRQVKIQWTNTSTSWPIAVDFWVKPSGPGIFSFNRRVYRGPGATNSGYQIFTYGDQVKGQVLYYNGTTSGELSAFSNIILAH
jgi:hypothetical protein